jgi:signal transduction histidine kinase
MLIDFVEHAENLEEGQELMSKLKPVVSNLHETLNELIESIQVSNDHDIEQDEVHLLLVLEEVVNMLRIEIEESKAVLLVDFSKVEKLTFPHKYLQSILLNLISNATKYRKPDLIPEVHISTAIDRNDVLLSVADNGLGIDLERHAQHMFRIRKVFHAHPDAKGFGLFMTKSQVESQGGKIWVESKVNEGSTFVVRFPNQIKQL